MGHTGLDTRVQESELGAVRQRCFDQIAIAPLNDPLVITANELVKESEALFQGFTPWERKALIPSNFIQGQTRNLRAAYEPTSHCALTSTCVAKKDQSHLLKLTKYRWNFAAIFYGTIPSNPSPHLGTLIKVESRNFSDSSLRGRAENFR